MKTGSPFESADEDDPHALILATQRAVVAGLKQALSYLKASMDKNAMKQNGLTWTQIDYFLDEFNKSTPTVIRQEHEM